ncbi:MAG: helix-turn-helix transcriptional regulator [Dehalococcoidia bacterium]
MQGTRDRVLKFLLDNHEARVEELAGELDITAPAVRRHLDHLRADGLVDARPVRQATGRPYHVYFPTEQALGVLSPAYVRLLEGVLQCIGENPEVAEGILAQVAETVADRHRADVAEAEGTQDRVERVTGSLRSEGILETWEADDDGIHLVNHQCPYRQAAEISKLPCESDRKTIELLLGLDVEQLRRIVDGAPVCEYIVRGDDTELRTESII